MGGGWASGAVDAEDATDAWCEQAWRAWRGQRIHRARKDGEWRAGVAPLGAMHLRTLAWTKLLRPRVPPQPTITPPSHMIPWNTHLRQADECCRGPTHAVLRLSTANLRNTARSQTVLTTNTTNTNADKTRTGLTLGATAAQLATQQCQRRPRPTPRSFLSDLVRITNLICLYRGTSPHVFSARAQTSPAGQSPALPQPLSPSQPPPPSLAPSSQDISRARMPPEFHLTVASRHLRRNSGRCGCCCVCC